MTTNKMDYMVVPSFTGKKWMIKKYRALRAIKGYKDRNDAIEHGKKLAKKAKTRLYVHKQDGRVEFIINMGNN